MWPGRMSVSPVCVCTSVHRCWFHVAWLDVNLTCMCVFLCPQVLVSCGLVECQSHLYVCLPLSTGVGFMWPGWMSISPVCVSSSVHRCWFHVAWSNVHLTCMCVFLCPQVLVSCGLAPLDSERPYLGVTTGRSCSTVRIWVNKNKTFENNEKHAGAHKKVTNFRLKEKKTLSNLKIVIKCEDKKKPFGNLVPLYSVFVLFYNAKGFNTIFLRSICLLLPKGSCVN